MKVRVNLKLKQLPIFFLDQLTEEDFINQEFMLRYLGKNFLIKGNYDYRGYEDLEFAGLDMRYKKNFGNLALSMGVAGRSHPTYLDFLPIDLWWAEQGIDTTEFTPFWDFAYFYGYTDEFVEQLNFNNIPIPRPFEAE